MTNSPPAPRVEVLPEARFDRMAADRIAESVLRAIAERGECSIALSGGSTPEPVYRCLAGAAGAGVRWDLVRCYFGDERAVPPDDPGSNFHMAKRALLDRVPLRPDRIHRMRGEAEDLDAAAADYARTLPAPLDLLLLGMGADGHTASLFPGSPALREARWVVPSISPRPPRRRLTITPPVIAAAREVLVMVRGAAKASLLARVLEGPQDPERYPVQLAIGGRWLVDDAAVTELGHLPVP